MSKNLNASVAVLLPCYNEEVTIGKVVRDFKTALPSADIYVYDNNSTDRTAEIAAGEGAIVRKEPRQGKGNVIRAMFEDIDADVYVMADGDETFIRFIPKNEQPHCYFNTHLACPSDRVCTICRNLNSQGRGYCDAENR